MSKKEVHETKVSSLYPYPDSLPPDVFVKVISLLRGTFGDPKEDVHYLWVVAGYAAGKGFSDEVRGVETAKVEGCSNEEAATLLETCCDHKGEMHVASVDALPPGTWKKIFGVVIKLLPLLLGA